MYHVGRQLVLCHGTQNRRQEILVGLSDHQAEMQNHEQPTDQSEESSYLVSGAHVPSTGDEWDLREWVFGSDESPFVDRHSFLVFVDSSGGHDDSVLCHLGFFRA
jgi:hypothetical protein